MIVLFAVAACAQPGQQQQFGTPEPEAFRLRADEVAAAWRANPALKAWQQGYVPLQDATVLPADPGFDDETKQAFLAGWYRSQVSLPTDRPADGVIQFPDGTLEVPLISAAEAYDQLDLGDPPPCPRRPAAPTSAPADDPDVSVSSPVTACTALTVTDAALGTVTVRTSRGEAQVPAWLFTVAELDGPVARVAVASPAVTPPPEISPPTSSVEGLVSAQDLTSVDGRQLTYRLGVGACDTDIKPLVHESEDLVVVAGTVTTSPGPCTMQLVLAPVTVTLAEPLGSRTVLDAVTGQPLLLRSAWVAWAPQPNALDPYQALGRKLSCETWC